MSLYGIKDSANLTLRKKKTKEPVLYAPYCNETSLSVKGDTVYAMSKGSKKIPFEKGKEGEIKIQTEVFDIQWLAIFLGTTMNESVVNLNGIERLTVSGGKVTLTETAKTGSLTVFVLNDDSTTHGKQLTAGTITTPDAYSITGKDITFNATSQPDGTKIIAYYIYDSKTAVKNFSVKATSESPNYEMVMHVKKKDTDGEVTMSELEIYNARPKTDINITLNADDVFKLEGTFDIFPDSANDEKLFDFKEIE